MTTRLCHDAGRNELVMGPLHRARARPSSTQNTLEQCVRGPRGCERGIGKTGCTYKIVNPLSTCSQHMYGKLSCLAVSAHEVCVHTVRLCHSAGRLSHGGIAGTVLGRGSDGMVVRGEPRAAWNPVGVHMWVARWQSYAHWTTPLCTCCKLSRLVPGVKLRSQFVRLRTPTCTHFCAGEENGCPS